jgi:Fur family ferric uptake transcriptional regulator
MRIPSLNTSARMTEKNIKRMTEALRAAGVRVTRQRIALLSCLAAASDHPDAIELHRRAQEIEPSVSLATVYRTLTVLEKESVIQRHSFEGGGARFEMANVRHHDHILDLDTGEIVEFRSEKIEQLQNEIAAEMGFDVVYHRLDMYCRRKDRET